MEGLEVVSGESLGVVGGKASESEEERQTSLLEMRVIWKQAASWLDGFAKHFFVMKKLDEHKREETIINVKEEFVDENFED